MAAQAQEGPSPAQMIAEMQKAGFKPPQASAPQDLTHDQMIQEMQNAGYSPGGNSFLDAHPTLKKMVQGGINDLPLAGTIAGGIVGEAAGVAAAPVTAGASLAAGGIGAGVGSAAGNALKDTLNNWVFGQNKDASAIAKDAGVEGVIDGASQAVGGAVLKGAGKLLGYAAEKVVPAAVISRYKQAADAIKEVMSSSGGDTLAAADSARGAMTESLDEFRSSMNEQISETLKSSTARVSPTSILEKLEEAKGRIHGDLPEAAGFRSQIDSYISSINKMKDENGQLFVQDLNSLKRSLQDQATAAYRGGTNGLQFADVAQKAASAARGLINKAAPEVAEANEKLWSLHTIEDTMNKSILKEGKSAAGVIAAGEAKSEAGKASAKSLRLLGDLTGQDFLGKAQDVAAVKAFGADSLLKRGAGAGVGAALGAGAAQISGNDPYHGAMIGGALGGAVTSPYAVKTAIDLGNYIPSQVAPVAGQALGQAVMHGTGAASALRKVGQ